MKESIPPDKNAPKGTSEIVCMLIACLNFSSVKPINMSSLSSSFLLEVNKYCFHTNNILVTLFQMSGYLF